jgi:hypothetical protein
MTTTGDRYRTAQSSAFHRNVKLLFRNPLSSLKIRGGIRRLGTTRQNGRCATHNESVRAEHESAENGLDFDCSFAVVVRNEGT